MFMNISSGRSLYTLDRKELNLIELIYSASYNTNFRSSSRVCKYKFVNLKKPNGFYKHQQRGSTSTLSRADDILLSRFGGKCSQKSGARHSLTCPFPSQATQIIPPCLYAATTSLALFAVRPPWSS